MLYGGGKMSVTVRVRTPSGKTEIWNFNLLDMSESTLKWYLEKKKKEGYEIIQVLSGAEPTSYTVKTSPSNLEKVKQMYLENMRKSVYDPGNIEKLRAFGWSEERIRQWQQETLKRAEETVKNPQELQKIAKYWVEKGKIPGEVVISDIQLKPTPEKPGIDEKKLRAIQRAKENLKDPIPQPKPTIQPTPAVMPKPTIQPTPAVMPKPTIQPTPAVMPKPVPTPPEKPKTGVLELAKKYWWVLGVVLGVGLILKLKR